MVVAIILSVIAVVIAVAAYIRAGKQSGLKYEYTPSGIIFYDKSGKRIVIQGESFK